MRRTFAFSALALVAAAGCQLPDNKVVQRLPPPVSPPLVQAQPGSLRPRLPQPKAAPKPAHLSHERQWTPPNGFSKRWQYIIVHHSGDERSSPAGIDAWHRQKGWDEMGYHFVIGNGVGYEDGRIFVGPRWPKQKHGAHTRLKPTDDNRYNERGIGICLVGNYENHQPTPKQMKALTELVAFLSKRCHVAPRNITTHGGVDPYTKCPGRHFSIAGIRQMVADQRVAENRQNGPVHASAH